MSSPFRADALEANRGGTLTDEQRAALRAQAGRYRGTKFVLALILAIGGAALVRDAGPSPAAWWHPIAGVLAIAIGAMTGLHALGVGNGFDRDVREGRVASIEGAIRKQRGLPTRGNNPRTDFFVIEGQRFATGPAGFEAAPDLGFVRLFYLPRSRRVVNLEELPARGPAAAMLQDPERALRSAAEAVVSGDRTSMAEIGADAAAAQKMWLADQARALAESRADAGHPRPLADAIVGTWTMGGLVRAEFRPDGGVVVQRPMGAALGGRWAVDAHGALRVDLDGESRAVEASIAGDVLTVSIDGTTLALRRA